MMKKTVGLCLSLILVMMMCLSACTDDTEVSKTKTVINTIGISESNCYALSDNNELFIWGSNYNEVVGSGAGTVQKSPLRVLGHVKGALVCEDIAGAIKDNNDLFVWGSNYNGQVGNGSTKTVKVPEKIMENVKAFYHCSAFSAAVTMDGELYVWGSNFNQDLGLNLTAGQITHPQKIMENVRTFRCIANDDGENIFAAITDSGKLYMWGSLYSRITCEQHTSVYEKFKGREPELVMEDVKDVVLSETNAAIITNKNDLCMLGGNLRGQLGTDDMSLIGSKPVKVLENVQSAYCRQYRSAALTKDRKLYVWGINDRGQVGNDTFVDAFKPALIMDKVSRFEMNEVVSAAIKEDGTLYMWGDGEHFRLGNNSFSCSKKPDKIMEGVDMVALDDNFTLALTTSGDVYNWGQVRDDYTDGEFTVASDPVEIPKKVLSGVSVIKAGQGMAMALNKDGEVCAWGNNDYKCMLGTGSEKNADEPQKLVFD